MQLVSFQVKECFGFQDSDHVDLHDPANLIYILGRNSSGKTSFLTALEYFAPSLIPETHPNFANFDSSPHAPYLLGEYRVGEGDLAVDTFVTAFRAKMDSLNIGNSTTVISAEYRRLTDELIKRLSKVYMDFIENVVRKGCLWVHRTASGEYRFSTELSFKDYDERRTHLIPTLVANIFSELRLQIQANGQMLVGGSWQPLRQLTPDEIESLLAHQLPVIIKFSRRYSLLDTLPDIIKLEHIAQSPGPLTAALVKYLNKAQVENLLKGQNPYERRKLLNILQEKINTLMNEVNQDHMAGTALLAVDLDRVDGLQVTVIAGGKPSFYRHLSDNTKFLFAYHLYMVVYKLNGNILLFDEPNNGFHATAQEGLLGFLRYLGSASNLVIVSTHSEHLIDPDYLTGIRLMTADDKGYLTIRNRWYTSTTKHGDFQALRPILDAIGLRYGTHHLTIHDKVIVTEGVTELLYLRAFRQLLGHESKLHVAPATGDETIPHVIALLISQGLHFKVVVDTTIGRKSAKSKLQDKYGIPDTSIYEVALPTEFPQAKGSGIEDIFSKASFAKLLICTGNTPRVDFGTLSNSAYMKIRDIVPKRIVAHEFNKHITNFHKDDFDEETLTNMHRILDFCTNEDWFLL